jgi:hypothetical protein
VKLWLWSRDAPNRCSCGGAYRPVLTGKGKLVKSREPAWSMAEQLGGFRDCLQERCRGLSKLYRSGYQHHSDSRKSGRGYPDCHFWVPRRPDGGGGSLFMELKRMDRGYPDGRDNPSADQVRVMGELQDAGHLVYLVRPCCVLVGAVDEILAAFTGTRCLYAGGNPKGKVTVDDVLADMAEPDPRPAAPAAAPRPARPGPALPGADPLLFPSAVGYIVPIPAGDTASAAVRGLEDWLATAGFPKTALPFPMRFVVGEHAVNVQVRVGLARAGTDQRVWRGGVPAAPFPERLVQASRADILAGPRSDKVAALIESAPPSSTLPDGEQLHTAHSRRSVPC